MCLSGEENTTMDINGLAELCEALKAGGALDDFELISLEQYWAHDKDAKRYRVTLTYGALQFVTSLPVSQIRHRICDLAGQIGERLTSDEPTH